MALEVILGNIQFRRMIISYLIDTGISMRIVFVCLFNAFSLSLHTPVQLVAVMHQKSACPSPINTTRRRSSADLAPSSGVHRFICIRAARARTDNEPIIKPAKLDKNTVRVDLTPASCLETHFQVCTYRLPI